MVTNSRKLVVWVAMATCLLTVAVVSSAVGAAAGTVTFSPGAVVSFESVNYPGYRIRSAADASVRIDRISSTSSATDRADATYVVRTGLASPRDVSFESATRPGWFLRSENGQVFLRSNDGTSGFAATATFVAGAGLTGSETSFALWSDRHLYLRHRNFLLWTEATDAAHTSLFRSDATFAVQTPLGSAAPAPTTTPAPPTTAATVPTTAGAPSPTVSPTTTVAARAATNPSWDRNGSYALVRDDEFSASGLDSSLWSAGWFPRTPGEVTAPEGPFNLACYDPTYVSQPGDGTLHLRLARTASTCGGGPKAYTGSMVTTREQFSQLGGAYEARIYVPGNRQGQAAGWPSWWLNGQSSTPYPAHGEVDIMEGWAARTSAILHYDDGTGRDPNLAWTPPANYLGWHTFGLGWTYTASQKSVTWYWDGAAVLTRNWPVTTPQYLVLSMAIAQPSGLPDSSSVEMLVDWVRVWK